MTCGWLTLVADIDDPYQRRGRGRHAGLELLLTLVLREQQLRQSFPRDTRDSSRAFHCLDFDPLELPRGGGLDGD